MVDNLGAVLGYNHHIFESDTSYPMFTFPALDRNRHSFLEGLREL